MYTQDFLDSPRESPGNTQRAQKEGLEFSEQQYKEILTTVQAKTLIGLSAWDVNSQGFLRHFDLNKIARR